MISKAVTSAQPTVSQSPVPMAMVMPPGLDMHSTPVKAINTPIQTAGPSRRRNSTSSKRGTNGT